MCLILFNNNYKLNLFKSCENLWIFIVKVYGYILVINFILMYPNHLQGYSKHQFSIHTVTITLVASPAADNHQSASISAEM